MVGVLTSVSSLAICLAMGNGFMVLPPQVAPLDSAGKKQAGAIPPLGAASTRVDTGAALARLGDHDDMEAGQRLPLVPSAGCYRPWGSRAVCPPLYASKGVEPGMTQDGNTTIPIVGGTGDAQEEDPGVTSEPQDEGVETALTAQPEHDDSTQGASSDSEIVVDIDIKNDSQTSLSREDSSDAANDESRAMSGGVDEETNLGPLDPAILGNAGDHDFDSWLNEGPSFDHVDESVVEEIFREIFGNWIAKDGDDRELSITLDELLFGKKAAPAPVAFNDPLDGMLRSVLLNDFAGQATVSEELMLDNDVYVLLRSVLRGAIASGAPSWDRMLDDGRDDIMWAKLHRALYGGAECTLETAEGFFDSLMASMLHTTLFGPAAIEAMASFTEDADNKEVVVQHYVRAVSTLYDKLKEVRDPTTNRKECRFDVAAADVFDEMTLRPFVSISLDDSVDDDVMGSVPHGIYDSAFNEERRLDTTADGVGDGIRLGPFGPVIPVDAVHGVDPPMLHHPLSDGETSVVFEKAANDIVMLVVEEATAGGASPDLMLDDGMANMMWDKLHHAVSVSGRAVSEPFDLGDALDAVSTSLLHRAFFGPAASKTVASLAENAGNSEAVVKDYVEAVSKLYDNFQEAKGRSPTPDNYAPGVRKAKNGGWTFVRKLWRRVRRKGG